MRTEHMYIKLDKQIHHAKVTSVEFRLCFLHKFYHKFHFFWDVLDSIF